MAPAGITKTQLNCDCKARWESNSRVFQYPNNCGDPEKLKGQDWCYVEDGCKDASGQPKKWDLCVRDDAQVQAKTAAMEADATSVRLKALTEFSTRSKTLKGCACDVWKKFDGYNDNHNKCGKDKGKGPWCFVKDSKCEGAEYGFCQKDVPSAGTSGAAAGAIAAGTVGVAEGTPTLVQTLKGCACDMWSSFSGYIGDNNVCGQDKGKGPWCFVKDKSCEGADFGFCGPAAGAAGAAGAPRNVAPQEAAVVGGAANLRASTAKDCGKYGSAQGQVCLCNPGYGGALCGSCAQGYEGFPTCVLSPCGCMVGTCNAATSKCDCPSNYAGDKCEMCASGFAAPRCFPMSTIQGHVMAAVKGTGRHHTLLKVFTCVALLILGSIAFRKCRGGDGGRFPGNGGKGYRSGGKPLPEL